MFAFAFRNPASDTKLNLLGLFCSPLFPSPKLVWLDRGILLAFSFAIPNHLAALLNTIRVFVGKRQNRDNGQEC